MTAQEITGLYPTIEALVEAKVQFIVIGGVAAIAHGATWVTLDVDICYDAAQDNRERLAALLNSLNAYPRDIELGLPFILDARTLRDHELLTLSTTVGDLDVTRRVPGVGDYAECLSRSEEIEMDGLRFRVLALSALIDAKRAARRPRDIEHLKILELVREERAREKDS